MVWHNKRPPDPAAPPEPPRPDPMSAAQAAFDYIEAMWDVNYAVRNRLWDYIERIQAEARVAAPEVGADASALPLDVERLAQSLWAYVARERILELGSMDMTFMPARFREVAEALAAEYARLSEPGSPTPPGEER